MDGTLLGALIVAATAPTATVIIVGIANARRIGKLEGTTEGMGTRLGDVVKVVTSLSRRVNHLYGNSKKK